MEKILLVKRMMFGVLFFCLAGLMTGSIAQDNSDTLVIQLDDKKINLTEFNASFDVAVRMLAAQQGIALGNQTPETIERLRQQYLWQRVSELALVQEAKTRGISVSEADIIAQAREIREKIDADESLDEPVDQVRLLELVREKQLVANLTSQLLEEIKIPAGDVVVLHHDLQDELRRPEQICLRQIVVEDEAKAQALLNEIQDGSDFEAMAMEHSTDRKTGDQGGDMGCFARENSRARSDFERAAFDAKMNELTGPVESEFGYHLLLVYKRIPSYIPTLNEAYDELESELKHEKLPQKLVEIRDASGVKTYPENL